MLRTLPAIGEAIRMKMPWVPIEETMYLVMDNAGGHGTVAAIEEYTHLLATRFNIEIIHQPARSPEVNALDLGVWMATQSQGERIHLTRARDPDTLANTVQEAWRDLPAESIDRIFGRIPINLQLIAELNAR